MKADKLRRLYEYSSEAGFFGLFKESFRDTWELSRDEKYWINNKKLKKYLIGSETLAFFLVKMKKNVTIV